jgi:adenylate kinase family enzyme
VTRLAIFRGPPGSGKSYTGATCARKTAPPQDRDGMTLSPAPAAARQPRGKRSAALTARIRAGLI